ncbi:MAG: gfo/Idh/MocA family oxidoreductase [Candidatus Omnitrophica bacterium]|nr:gfo/Idh/MocA family oxidoreductase [Candidatus Omnitrophota bacterium]
MDTIRVGVVGTGHLGAFHVKAYNHIKKKAGITLTGVCDVRKKVAKELSKKYHVPYFTNHKDLLDKVDVVSIVVPTVHHHAVARDFLEAGVHVLLEKPITRTLEEADDLVGIAREKGLILQVGHIERFNPAIRAVEPLIEKPKFIDCQRLGSIKKKSRIKDVGVVLDLMIHDIDIILGLVKSRVKSIEAVGMKTITDHEDAANVRITFQNNVIADITASRITREETRKIRIFQQDSYILLDFMHREAFRYMQNQESPNEEKIRIKKKDALQVELKSFIDCVRNDKDPIVSGQQGRDALEVALKILEKIEGSVYSIQKI